MLNKKEKQLYTKEDNRFFDILSNFKTNNKESEIKFKNYENKFETKYTTNDYNNFNYIINNNDEGVSNNNLNNNSQNQKDLDYNKNDLKNFEKLDNKLYVYDVNNVNFKNKIKSSKKNEINYEKNDLENFNQIIKNEENNEKNSVKIVNEYEGKNSKFKNENLNLKKIKILYFD